MNNQIPKDVWSFGKKIHGIIIINKVLDSQLNKRTSGLVVE